MGVCVFESLSERLSGVFSRLTGRGALSERDVDEALREVRLALLEADVALPVVKTFLEGVREKAVGEAVIRAVAPGQQVVKVVHDALVDMLGGAEDAPGLNLNATPPVVILMAGLQGSGKTTTAGKLAKRLKERDRKKVMLASLDTRRPAAMEQLQTLAKQVGAESLPIIVGQTATEIAKRAIQAAKLAGCDVVILDTAGRTTLDDEMMDEAAEIARLTTPTETLLVADSLTGQDAVRTAAAFHARLPLTGLVLTRMDGDGRGGAALSMRSVTGLPIKFLGTSEKLDGLDAFDARRVAGRILGQGDVVSLVERAAAEMDAAQAEKMAAKMAKGEFDLDDLAAQLGQMQRMGGLAGIAGMLPGMAGMKKQIDAAHMDDRKLKQQQAIIYSMTAKERRKPAVLDGSRRKRIAKGAGVDVAEVNRVLKMHRQMADMMKMMGKGGGKGFKQMFAAMQGQGMMGSGGMPDMGQMPDMTKLQEMAKAGPAALPGLPGLGGAALPKGLPGLPGFPGFKK